jgi:hypothetical protein
MEEAYVGKMKRVTILTNRDIRGKVHGLLIPGCWGQREGERGSRKRIFSK